MYTHQSQPITSSALHKMPHKLIAGIAAFAATAIIATSSFAGAQTPSQPQTGAGYGGNSVSVTNNLNLTLNHSNNNVINVVTNVVIKIFN